MELDFSWFRRLEVDRGAGRALPGLQTAAFLLYPHVAFLLHHTVLGRQQVSSLVSLKRANSTGSGLHPYDLI